MRLFRQRAVLCVVEEINHVCFDAKTPKKEP